MDDLQYEKTTPDQWAPERLFKSWELSVLEQMDYITETYTISNLKYDIGKSFTMALMEYQHHIYPYVEIMFMAIKKEEYELAEAIKDTWSKKQFIVLMPPETKEELNELKKQWEKELKEQRA